MRQLSSSLVPIAGPLRYTDLPQRAIDALDGFMAHPLPGIDEEVKRFASVQARPMERDGDTEELDGVVFTHRIVRAPGDKVLVPWHVVETGFGEPVVLLHGIPDSWYQWRYVMASLAKSHRCIAIDLKGYGQSGKEPGDYRYEGVADQIVELLYSIGIAKFNLVTHDRGTVYGDYVAAKHPYRVLRYVRGEQHLYHYHPMLSPQEHIFAHGDPMKDAVKFIVWGYGWATSRKVSDADIGRTIQEYMYPGIPDAVPRSFNTSTFTQEWIDRRTRLLAAWLCPILIMEGFHSKTQPRELYENAREYIPNAQDVQVKFIDAGHFWTLENPEESSAAIRQFLSEPAFDAEQWLGSLKT